MDKDFSIDELLSEYNERLDRLGGKKKEPEKKAEQPAEESTEQAKAMAGFTTEFDSQPDRWIPPESEEDIKPVIAEQPSESEAEQEAEQQTRQDEFAQQINNAADALPLDMPAEQELIQQMGEAEPEGEQDSPTNAEGDEQDEQQSPQDAQEERRERNERNAAVISNLSKMKRQKAKRGENVSPKNRASLKDFKLGLTGKIIPKTEEFDKAQIPDNNTSFEERSEFLSKRRRKKVENFRLDTEDGSDGFDRVSGGKTASRDEFESFEQAPELLSDILELKMSLRRRLLVLVIAAVVGVLLALANDFRIALVSVFDRTVHPAVYTVLNVLLGGVAVFEGYTVIRSGIKNLINANADCDSIAAIGMISGLFSGFMALFSTGSVSGRYYHIYIVVGIVGLVCNTIGKIMIVDRTENNFRYIAGEYDRYAVKTVENEDVAANFTQGYVDEYPMLAKMQKTEFVKDFMKNSYCTDAADALSRRVSPMILLCGLLLGLLSFVFDKGASSPVDKILVALAAYAGTVSMCSSIALIFVVNMPMTRASQKYLKHSAIMMGYNSVDEFSQTNSVLVEAKQLFPMGMVDFIKLKMLSTTSLEECILMAASLSCQADSVLKSAFYKMLRGKTEMLYPVESYIYEDGQGLSGWIENKRILLGTRELMENHSIEGLPPLAKEMEYAGENVAVYLSISGVVTTLFVVRAMASPSISGWMQELENEGVVTVIRTVDSFLTKDFICNSFGVEPDSVKFLPFRYHKDYDEQTDYVPKTSASVVCSGHFQSLAMLILGAKKLKNAADLGVAFQFGGMAMGALLCLIMSITGAFAQISASAVLGYNLLMVIVAMIVQQFKKI
ncbi:hypothetical protein [Ruminococcus sp. FC2018]|uniref:hypothetical protein n=1 Tax=Ruminococcus sp. FC2018 TaxID=1410617 RepID=UPI000684ED71|nr:hypothetical protein [Ruminococcus sp. FC2018]